MKKQRWEESEKRREERRSEKRKSQARRQKMQVHEKVAKSRNTVFFQWFVPPEGQKVGSLKRRVRSRREMKNCTPLWREARFEVKCTKHIKDRQSTTCSCHFWTLKRRFVRQAQGILHPAKSEQNLRVL